MVYKLTQQEFNQLQLVKRGILTNERLAHDSVAIANLIEKGLLVPNGIAVKVSTEGEKLIDGSCEYAIVG